MTRIRNFKGLQQTFRDQQFDFSCDVLVVDISYRTRYYRVRHIRKELSLNKFYSFKANSLQGEPVDFNDFKGKVVLVVNTASRCGFTPQYAGLQDLHEKYSEQGLEILAFPCNQFGQQEPGDAESIQRDCLSNYGVSFKVFEKIDVNGNAAHPLFKFLKKELKGKMGSSIKWNFTKFLIDADGNPVKRFGSRVKPDAIENDIKQLLPSMEIVEAV